jgi:Flp pilus assembly protein TadD
MPRKRKTATQPGRPSRSKRRTDPPWVLDLSLAEFRVSNEQTTYHTPEVERIVTQATVCLKARDGLDAERLFRQALVLEPDEPDLWNNLAAALGLQRREAEALAIIREVHVRFPDYLFARTALARQAMLQGQLDLA